jgi:hypothetical protein
MTDMAVYLAEARAAIQTLIDEFQAGSLTETQALRQSLRLQRKTLRALADLARLQSFTAILELEPANTLRTVTVFDSTDTGAWLKAAKLCAPGERVRSLLPGLLPSDEPEPT